MPPVPSTCNNNNLPKCVVSANQGYEKADEIKDVVNLASVNTILNLHEFRRGLNSHLANFDEYKFGRLELK